MKSAARPGSARGEGSDFDSHPASVRNLVKRYRAKLRPALDGVDLDVDAGQVHALVGESGSGKTTLLRLIAGLEVPEAGEVRIGERVVAGPGVWVPPERRGVGMVFQDFALFPHMTVEDNVAFGLRGAGAAERSRRAAAMLKRVGLGGLGARFPHQLSGGQKQRVALARALAPKPRLLLLDEPFSNLDVPLKVELREEIGRLLRGSGVTVLLVVHEMDDVFHLADSVTVIREGTVVQSGTPEEVYTEPSCVYVARLFGETNLLPGRPVEEGLKTPLGVIPCPGGLPWGPRRSVEEDAESGHLMVRPEDVIVKTVPRERRTDRAERRNEEGEEGGKDREGRGRVAVVRDVRFLARSGRVRLVLEAEEGERRHRVFADAEELPVGIGVGSRVRITVRPGSFKILPRDPWTGGGSDTPSDDS